MAECALARLTGVVVFIVGLAARLAFVAWHGPVLNLDSEKYLTLAHNLALHGTLSLDAAPPFATSIRFPPLYPVFIALLGWTDPASPAVIASAQTVLGALTAVVIFLLARAFVPLKWAGAVALLYALHPGAIASAGTVLAETLFTALLVVAVWILSIAVRADRPWMTAGGAVLLGLAILCRPLVLMWPLAFCCVMLLTRTRRLALHGLVLAAVTLLTLTPWSVRASRVAGHVALQDPLVVAGLFCVASHWDWNQTLFNWVEFRRHPLRFDAAGLFREGVSSIRAHPFRYLQSRARALPYLFISSFDSFTGIYQSYGTLLSHRDWLRLSIKLLLLSIFSLAPLALSLAGLPAARASTTAALCASIWIYTLIFFLPLWVEPRYWLPATPFVLLSSGAGGHALMAALKARRA